VTADITRTAGGRARVLVVDDDARVRRAVCALIRYSPGLAVAGEASSATETLRADDELAPDIVLLDLLLPSPDEGLDVLRRLATGGRTVVALSVREGLRTTAVAAGAAAFVEKYAGADELLAALVKVAPAVRPARPASGP
jgi:two-component system nitrate/nitrite response regulator NarL